MVIKSLADTNARKIEQAILKPAGYYFLVSLTVVTASQFMQQSEQPNAYYFFPIVGGLVLYAYLMGKMEQRKFMVQLNSQLMNQRKPEDMKYEPIYIAVALALYTVAFYIPQLANNNFMLSLFASIQDIYNTPVIGWIFGLIGVFFLLNMIFRAVGATSTLLNKLMGRETSQSGFKSGGSFTYTNQTDSDGFTDYEEVDEEEETPENDGKSLE